MAPCLYGVRSACVRRVLMHAIDYPREFDMQDAIRNFWNDEQGVTAIEYGLIAALIAVFIIGSLQLVGTSLGDVFTAVSTAVNGAL
jgi:pilus assembly protein Flp/PilA